MTYCEVSYSEVDSGPKFNCEREVLEGEDRCVLHSESSDKGEKAFEEALEEHREERDGDFRQVVFPTKADFSDTTFEDEARFWHATFEDGANFREATFEYGANFPGATFEDGADFRDATFEDGVTFAGATFEDEANFRAATFEDMVSFHFATFEDETDFKDTTFEYGADFVNATFEYEADFMYATFFRHATFEYGADFRHATFGDEADFRDATFEDEADFRDASFEDETDFRDATFKDEASFQHSFEANNDAQFVSAKFGDCKFEGGATFTGSSESSRAFARGEISFFSVTVASDAELHFRYADLSRCRFLRTDLRDVEFTGVKWCREFSIGNWFSLDWFRGKEWFDRVGLYDEVEERRKRRSLFDVVQTTVDRMGSSDGPHWTLSELEEDPEEGDEEQWREVERLYRQLKRNYEERGDFPRGGDFHIGEKEARRKSSETSGPLKFLLYAYRAFSKYGERAIPAAISLLVVVLGCAVLYSLFDATLVEEATGHTLGIADPEGPLTFSESLRVSLEASFYPVRPIGFEGLGTYILSVVQRLLSPVLIALLALALRQRVKR